MFVNTIIAAYNAQAVNPELMFVKQSDRNAAQEKTVYYTLATKIKHVAKN